MGARKPPSTPAHAGSQVTPSPPRAIRSVLIRMRLETAAEKLKGSSLPYESVSSPLTAQRGAWSVAGCTTWVAFSPDVAEVTWKRSFTFEACLEQRCTTLEPAAAAA